MSGCRNEARSKIEARASERLAREQAEYEAKIAAREAKAKASGKKPGGKPPAPPAAGPGPTDQINLTDEDFRIMPVAGGGFEQCYNAQAVVTADSLLVVAGDVVQAANDKRQLEPMLGKLAALPADLGRPETMLGDNGYFSAANVTACAAAGIEPLLAHRITRPWTSALPRHRPHRRTRRRSKPWRTRRQEALRPAQTHPGASVRHHQAGPCYRHGAGRLPVAAGKPGGAEKREGGRGGLRSRDCPRPSC